MKFNRLVLLVFANTVGWLLCPAGSLYAQTAGSPDAGEKQLIAADRGILEAMSGAHPDTDKLARILAPEYEEVEEGQMESRDALLRALKNVTHFSFEYESPQAVLLSPTSGYVIADVRYSYPFNGSPVKEHRLNTTVFALRGGQWVATLHTETPIANDLDTILARPEDSNPDVIAMRRLAMEVMSQVHVPGYAPFPFFPVSFNAGTAVSFSNHQGAHEADFSALPAPLQQIWTQWASYTKDEPSGEALFKDMFYRFFLVHELGHLIAYRVMNGMPATERQKVLANEAANATEKELVANRIAVAWFREHDPQYLARLVADFRLIGARLPNPVPEGADPKRYFTENYDRLGADPLAYGWYQLYMVVSVYEEPAKSFQQTMDSLPKIRYDEE